MGVLPRERERAKDRERTLVRGGETRKGWRKQPRASSAFSIDGTFNLPMCADMHARNIDGGLLCIFRYANAVYTITIGAIGEDNGSPYYTEPCAATLAVTYSSSSHGQCDNSAPPLLCRRSVREDTAAWHATLRGNAAWQCPRAAVIKVIKVPSCHADVCLVLATSSYSQAGLSLLQICMLAALPLIPAPLQRPLLQQASSRCCWKQGR